MMLRGSVGGWEEGSSKERGPLRGGFYKTGLTGPISIYKVVPKVQDIERDIDGSHLVLYEV